MPLLNYSDSVLVINVRVVHYQICGKEYVDALELKFVHDLNPFSLGLVTVDEVQRYPLFPVNAS